MFEPKIRLNRELYERLRRTAAKAGYSSAEEFALHVLDKAAPEAGEDVSEDKVRERLRGLGYLG